MERKYDKPKPNIQPWREIEFRLLRPTFKMTSVQRWISRCLLQQMFTCDTRPYLPDDDDELWLLADCESKEQWLENKEEILRLFKRVDINVHPMLEVERVTEDYKKFARKSISSDEKGYVYFLQGAETKRVKIGYSSSSPENRLSALQIGSSENLALLGFMRAPRRMEHETHVKWGHLNHRGEWFNPSEELLEFIKEVSECPSA